jgi:hypothetical protein
MRNRDWHTACGIADRANRLRQRAVKARFSLVREPVGDDKNAGCCQQRIDDDCQFVVPAIEALVGEQPGICMLDDAANGAQPGAVRLGPLADQRQDALGRAQPAVLGAMICGISIEPRDRSADHQARRSRAGNSIVSFTLAAEGKAASGRPSLATMT